MFFLSKSELCSICGKSTGKEILNGFLCKECREKAGEYLRYSGLSNNLLTVEKVKEMEKKSFEFNEIQKERQIVFDISKQIGGFKADENNMLFSVEGLNYIYKFDDVRDFELLEDNESIVKGGIGRALAGGVLFGGAGAIVGGVTGKRKAKKICNNMKLRIYVKGYPFQCADINLIVFDTEVGSLLYNNATNIAGGIMSFISSLEKESVSDKNSSYEELKKLKELLDMGIITQEEFDVKKKKILDI